METVIATTKSGAVYSFTGGQVHIKPATPGITQFFSVWDFKVGTIKGGSHKQAPWFKDSPEWEISDYPQVGYRMYVNGRDEWRISSAVVSVDIQP